MEDTKKNKSMEPRENKAVDNETKVRIVFKPGRGGEGAIAQGDGTWLADEKSAAYWVKIGYADYVE